MRNEEIMGEIIKTQEEYISFLDKESLPFIHFANIHGMSVSKEVATSGEAYRLKINTLKTILSSETGHHTTS